MTIGDILDALQRIAELEEKIREVHRNPDKYYAPEIKIDEYERLIAIQRSRSIDDE